MKLTTIPHMLEHILGQVLIDIGFDCSSKELLLASATRPEFGDYQINGIMPLAKTQKINPRTLAEKFILAAEPRLQQAAQDYQVKQIIQILEIAGPGFINITLANEFLSIYLQQLTKANKYGTTYLGHKALRVIVDMSSPNLAKEMHVGHLRSTVIGDALARMCSYMGDTVIRQNHVGDWGTQFGMLVAYLMKQVLMGDADNDSNYQQFLTHAKITDLEDFYRKAKIEFDNDEQFAMMARRCVVALQHGSLGLEEKYEKPLRGFASFNDEYRFVRLSWQKFCALSMLHCEDVYRRLKINWHNPDHLSAVRGESTYNDNLPIVVKRLADRHLLNSSEGAQCIFFAEGELPGNETTPFIVQKQDGAYLYATTDLAAMIYRVEQLHADRIIYVVDARQALHFKQLFIVGKKANFAHQETLLEHAAFGTMMNDGGTPFKTRDGGTVKLIDLLDEAKSRAAKLIVERNSDWSESEQNDLAETLAIDAIKYADLAKNRNSDYIFSLDKMLAFDGNTAPYLLYAYTRIQSLLDKAYQTQALSINSIKGYQLCIQEVAEHKLALHLSQFAPMLNLATKECYPHYICQYVYVLAGLFMQFYEVCPVLNIGDDKIRNSRLKLASLTAEILAVGLEDLLGIELVKRM